MYTLFLCITLTIKLMFLRITSRRKKLARLREQDYKKYEWLLEKLNILYKPMPHDAPDGVVVPKENVARNFDV